MVDGMVSVVTSIYNSERYIAKAIESVLAQTYSDWEMIITDDCSTDKGLSIVESYAANDPRIHLLRLETNGGPGTARNNSVMNARGRYVAFLDSDDMWSKDKLEKQLALMKEKACGVVYSSYYVCDENDTVKGMVRCRRKVSFRRIACDNCIGFLTMMYDRKVTGDFMMSEIRKRQDWGLNIMLIRKSGVAYGVREPLATYRIHAGSVSRKKLSLIKYNVNIYRSVLGFSKVGSVLMFIFVFMPFYTGKKLLNFLQSLFDRK